MQRQSAHLAHLAQLEELQTTSTPVAHLLFFMPHNYSTAVIRWSFSSLMVFSQWQFDKEELGRGMGDSLSTFHKDEQQAAKQSLDVEPKDATK